MLLLFDLVGGTLCVYQAIFLEIYAFESTPVIVSCNNIPSSPPRAMFDVKTFFLLCLVKIFRNSVSSVHVVY